MEMDRELELIIKRKAAEILRRSTAGRERCPEGPLHADPQLLHSVLSKCGVVLADFWAAWCGFCRLVEPVVRAVADKYAGKMAVVKVNVDENPELAARYGVTSLPTLILFCRGREYRRFVGFHPLLGRRVMAEVERLLRVCS